MFTGIITHIGSVKKLSHLANQDLLIEIELNFPNDRSFEIGCSIACNGICLTLVNKNSTTIFFQASPETLAKTNLKHWKINDKINIEFALRIGDELGGHLVSGHVDAKVKIKDIRQINSDSHKFTFEIPKDLKKFIAPKGSIVLNGVSLTINEVLENSFNINIIKHTFDHTNFSNLKIGDEVNLEVDLIARYLNQLMNHEK